MSNMARTDEIDDLVSSVRNFVSHKDTHKQIQAGAADRLVLTPELRIDDNYDVETPSIVNVTPLADERNVLHLGAAKRDDRAGLEATIAELEAAVTAQYDDWEPDEGESFEQSAWAASAFQTPQGDSDSHDEFILEYKHLDTYHVPEPRTAPVDLKEAEIAAAVSSGFDQEALRALVVEIVHDELGGELGERITRNVRKLVRREINRVLTSREMGQL